MQRGLIAKETQTKSDKSPVTVADYGAYWRPDPFTSIFKGFLPPYCNQLSDFKTTMLDSFVSEHERLFRNVFPFVTVRTSTLTPAEMGFFISSRFASACKLVISTGVSIRLILDGRRRGMQKSYELRHCIHRFFIIFSTKVLFIVDPECDSTR